MKRYGVIAALHITVPLSVASPHGSGPDDLGATATEAAFARQEVLGLQQDENRHREKQQEAGDPHHDLEKLDIAEKLGEIACVPEGRLTGFGCAPVSWKRCETPERIRGQDHGDRHDAEA